MAFPARPFLEAYWLGYVNSDQDGGPGLDLKDVPTSVDVIKIAFYNLWPNNQVSMCYGMSKNHGWQYLSEALPILHGQGQKVMASLIGTPYPAVGWSDISDPTAFAENVKYLLIDQLGLDGIDLDNENTSDQGQPFQDIVTALRTALGPKGSGKYLSAPVYPAGTDPSWLQQVGDKLDWVSTMAYWGDTAAQQATYQIYADILGTENVLIGVANQANRGQNTPLQTVLDLPPWNPNYGTQQKGGMMLWGLSTNNSGLYADTIKQNLQ